MGMNSLAVSLLLSTTFFYASSTPSFLSPVYKTMTRLRYLLHTCHLFLALLPLLLSVEILRAQEWTPDLAQDGVPSAEHWRLDRNHFAIHEGKIQLHAPRPKARGLSVLSTSSLLPERPSFTGRIAWDTRLSQTNYSYVLLCCIASSGDTYDYVALALGGGYSGLSLVRLSVQLMSEGSSPRIHLRQGATLVEDERGETIQTSSLDYRVDYSREEGWTLYVASPKKPHVWHKVGVSNEPKVDLVRANSFAWVCGYSPTNNEAWELSEIKITPIPKEDTPPRPDDEEPQAQGIDPRPGQHIILSEVMSAPKTDGCEYIELYNPTEEALSLLPYRLAVGKDVDSFKLFAFPDQSLSSKAFLVLTKDAQQFLRLYPQLSPEEVLESITGFHLHRGALAAMNRPGLDGVPDLLAPSSRGGPLAVPAVQQDGSRHSAGGPPHETDQATTRGRRTARRDRAPLIRAPRSGWFRHDRFS